MIDISLLLFMRDRLWKKVKENYSKTFSKNSLLWCFFWENYSDYSFKTQFIQLLPINVCAMPEYIRFHNIEAIDFLVFNLLYFDLKTSKILLVFSNYCNFSFNLINQGMCSVVAMTAHREEAKKTLAPPLKRKKFF